MVSTNKKKAVSSRKTKKIKKIPSANGIISGHFSFNNTIVVLAKDNGDVLAQFSAGSIGYRGSKKSTSYASQKVAEKIIERAGEYGITEVKLQLKNIGPGRDAVMRKVIEAKNLSVKELIDKTPVPFGKGTRPRKRPRK
jgi:small subunit ribosomal protein S11